MKELICYEVARCPEADANLQVNERNPFTHPSSCILPSFSQNPLELLLAKGLWKFESTISFWKCKWRVVLLVIFLFRSSRPEVFYKTGVLRNFTKFTGKHLCQSLFFNKITGLSPATLLKKRLWHRRFPVNFAKFVRTPFLTEHLRWLLLPVQLRFIQVNFLHVE